MIKCHWPWLPARQLAAVFVSSPVRPSHGVDLVHGQSLLLPPRGLGCSHAIEAQYQIDTDPPALVDQELWGRTSGLAYRIVEYYLLFNAFPNHLLVSTISCLSCCRYSWRLLGRSEILWDCSFSEFIGIRCLLGLRLRARRHIWRRASLSFLKLSMLFLCLMTE